VVSLLFTALLTACPTTPVDPLPVPEEPYGETVSPKGTSILVEVQDTQGSPVTGAVVKTQDKEVEVDARGMVLLEELTSTQFVLRVEAPGFVPHAREMTLEAGASSTVPIRLMRQGPPQRFDTSQASQVRSGGIKVSLPAGSLRDAEGNPVTGPADMHIAPIDPTTDAIHAAPGPLVGISAGDGEQVPLESFFMAEINIQQEGRPLQLAEGAKATLEFPIPAAIHDRAPVGTSIPAWWFDTQSGTWREEGAGVVTESPTEPGKRVWTVQVGHFTSWNADKPYDRSTCIKVRVIDTQGMPVQRAQLQLQGVNIAAYNWAQTETDGRTCMLAPVNSRVKLSTLGTTLEVDTSATPATCTSASGGCTEVTLTTKPMECSPGTWQTCPYGGPAGTAGVGSCRAGYRYCDYTGRWSSCAGQVTPREDVCTNALDEDCNGTANDSCPTICQNGQTRSCYSGPAGTSGVGICRASTQTCEANGTNWSPCWGERTPLPREYCFNSATDEDCDGQSNEGCTCLVGQTRSCYSGPAGTSGVGVCSAGIQRCHMGADWGTFWSACSGEVLPSPEDCSKPEDENCDGTSSCGECTPGETRSCYSGPEGTQGVGRCVGGTQTCGPTGIWQACTGEVTPQPAELCTTAEDDDCDGQSNESPTCVCTPQETRSCYSGPANTQGVGRCRAGAQACIASGEAWEAACTGEFLPEYERCDGTDRDCDGASTCTGAWTWSTPFIGGPEAEQFNDSTLSASDVAVDAQGNVFLTGTFDKAISLGGTLHTGKGNTDLFLVKLNSTGVFQWGKVFGDAQLQQVRAITLDASGRVIVVGHFQGTVAFGGTALTTTGVDGFVAVFTNAGEHVWSARFAADTNLQPSDVAVDGAGNVLVAGNFSGSFPCQPTTTCTSASSSQDLFVRAYSSEGTERWTRTFGGAGLDQVNSLAVNGAGELALAGSFTEGFSFGPACPTLNHAGSEDGFVAKLSTMGACVWSQRFGDLTSQQATAVSMNSAGEVFLGGNYQGSVTFGGNTHSSLGGFDFFVVKFDAQGVAQWSRGFGGTQDQTLTNLVLEPVGNLVLAGNFLGSLKLGEDPLLGGPRTRNMFVAKLSATNSASHLWSRGFGDGDEQVAKGLAVGSRAQVVVTGDFGGTINFGGVDHASRGIFDVAVAQLKP
jgi:hypothetical protein